MVSRAAEALYTLRKYGLVAAYAGSADEVSMHLSNNYPWRSVVGTPDELVKAVQSWMLSEVKSIENDR